jgi:hypothetical protein
MELELLVDVLADLATRPPRQPEETPAQGVMPARGP